MMPAQLPLARPADDLQTCPLCHTVRQGAPLDADRNAPAWTCARCGQSWSSGRLETAAAYVRFAAGR